MRFTARPVQSMGTLRVATNCFFLALNWNPNKLPVVTGPYVSSGASQTKTVGGRLSFFTAIGSFRLPAPKLTIRLAVSFKTRES
jgi:hypothetical protein